MADKFEIPLKKVRLQNSYKGSEYTGLFGEFTYDKLYYELYLHDAVTPDGIPVKINVDNVLKIAKVAKTNLYTDLDALPDLSIYELSLGNPLVDGYLLSSTTAGQRSWVAPYTHPEYSTQQVSAQAGQVLSSFSSDTQGHVTGIELRSLAATDIPSLDWAKITSGIPTTLLGYGITDAYTKLEADSKYALAHTHPYLSDSDSRIANWTAAYSFTSGFGTNYPDLSAIETLSGTTGLLRKTAANTWGLDNSTYLTSYTETDPIWISEKSNYYTKTEADGKYSLTHTHPYLSDSDSRIANWTAAYSHSLLTSGNPHGVSKSDIGLGSVENTALSTWSGSGGSLNNLYISNGAGYVTSSALSGYATESWVNSYFDYYGYFRLVANSSVYNYISSYGDLSFVSGSGITFSNSGGSLVISATGSGMVYPGAGIAVSTGSSWGTSITDNSANWNYAYNQVTTAGYISANQNITISGAMTGSGTTAISLTPTAALVTGRYAPGYFLSADGLIMHRSGQIYQGTISELQAYMQSNLSFGSGTVQDLSLTGTTLGLTNSSVTKDLSSVLALKAGSTSQAFSAQKLTLANGFTIETTASYIQLKKDGNIIFDLDTSGNSRQEGKATFRATL